MYLDSIQYTHLVIGLSLTHTSLTPESRHLLALPPSATFSSLLSLLSCLCTHIEPCPHDTRSRYFHSLISPDPWPYLYLLQSHNLCCSSGYAIRVSISVEITTVHTLPPHVVTISNFTHSDQLASLIPQHSNTSVPFGLQATKMTIKILYTSSIAVSTDTHQFFIISRCLKRPGCGFIYPA